MPTEIPQDHGQQDQATATRSAPMPFYVLSARKLLLLDLATLGIYKLVWFYRNWQVVQHREQRRMQPFWRTLFTALFCFSLFRYIENNARRIGVQVLLPAWLLSVLIWLFSVPGAVDERYSLIGLLMIVPVLYANNVAHRANWYHDEHFVAEDRFTPMQRYWLALGVLLWSIVVQGLLFAPTPV